MPYDKWHSRLKGEKVLTFTEPDHDDCGFYRLPKRERHDGKWVTIGYEPVALFSDGDDLVCQINGIEVPNNRRDDAWTWFVQNPITEEVYRAVADRGDPWPDQHIVKPKAAKSAPAHAPDASADQPEVDPIAAMMKSINDAAADIALYAKIESDDLLAKAHNLRDQIRKLGTDAEKTRKAEKEVHLRAGNAVDAKWRPVLALASDKIALLTKPMEAWVNEKLEAERLRLERERKQREEHEKALKDAEANNAPPPPAPAAPVANTPAPSMQIKSAGARTSNVRLRKVVSITDPIACFAFFKTNSDVLAALEKAATTAVNAGIEVPGTTYVEEGKV